MPVDTPQAAAVPDLLKETAGALGIMAAAAGAFLSWQRSRIARRDKKPVDWQEAALELKAQIVMLKKNMDSGFALLNSGLEEVRTMAIENGEAVQGMRDLEIGPIKRKLTALEGEATGDRSEWRSRFDRLEEMLRSLLARNEKPGRRLADRLPE